MKPRGAQWLDGRVLDCVVSLGKTHYPLLSTTQEKHQHKQTNEITAFFFLTISFRS